MPFVSVAAAPQRGSREAGMEFLEYLGTFEAGGDVLNPPGSRAARTGKKESGETGQEEAPVPW